MLDLPGLLDLDLGAIPILDLCIVNDFGVFCRLKRDHIFDGLGAKPRIFLLDVSSLLPPTRLHPNGSPATPHGLEQRPPSVVLVLTAEYVALGGVEHVSIDYSYIGDVGLVPIVYDVICQDRSVGVELIGFPTDQTS